MLSPTNSLTTNPAPPRRSRLPSLIIMLVCVASVALVAANQRNLIDWWRLRGYDAPTAVVQLADQTAMSDYGRKVFYVNKPELVSKTNFSSVCPAGREHTIVLGCYHGGQNGIYLLDVSDARLDGVEQVTAAHEMLHGVYERLDAAERKRIDGLLQAFYEQQVKDGRIIETINAYKQSEPNDVVNEMHSIFATEIRSLTPELESYYQQHFKDRLQVVAYAERYQAEFTSRDAAIDAFDAQLKALKERIDATELDLRRQQQSLENQQLRLNRWRSSGDIEAYNAAVPAYNALIDSYNYQVEQVKALIAEHNSLVAARNNVALEADKLLDEISGSVDTINN